MGKRRSTKSKSKGSQSDWNKGWNTIQCCNCANPVKVSSDTQKVVCSACIIQDPLNAAASFSGKSYKHFKMAAKYLRDTADENLSVILNEPTPAKQDEQKNNKTFGWWAKKQREKEKKQ